MRGAGLLRRLSWVAGRHGERAAGFILAALERSDRSAGAALVYHRTGEATGDPARELVPAHGSELFRAQLAHVRERYDVVVPSALLSAVQRRRPGQRFPVAITFDDDLACHVDHAAPELQRAGLPAAFFLTGASLLNRHEFWWERLQRADDDGITVAGLAGSPSRAPATVHELAARVKLLTPGERDQFEERLIAATGPGTSDGALTAGEVRQLADTGFEIGFHTRDHHYLPVLDDGTLHDALTRGRDEVAKSAGHALEAIAYPHGGCDHRVARAAHEAGFRLGFTTEPRAVVPKDDPLMLGRLEPSFVSVGLFALELSLLLARGLRSAQ